MIKKTEGLTLNLWQPLASAVETAAPLIISQNRKKLKVKNRNPKLKNGKTIKVGYDNHNGHPYVSIGKILIEDKELKNIFQKYILIKKNKLKVMHYLREKLLKILSNVYK